MRIRPLSESDANNSLKVYITKNTYL